MRRFFFHLIFCFHRAGWKRLTPGTMAGEIFSLLVPKNKRYRRCSNYYFPRNIAGLHCHVTVPRYRASRFRDSATNAEDPMFLHFDYTKKKIKDSITSFHYYHNIPCLEIVAHPPSRIRAVTIFPIDENHPRILNFQSWISV